jgi:hypothetical protein
MSVDERLKVLTETVRILAGCSARMRSASEKSDATCNRSPATLKPFTIPFGRLERIALAHKERLDGLEGK